MSFKELKHVIIVVLLGIHQLTVLAIALKLQERRPVAQVVTTEQYRVAVQVELELRVLVVHQENALLLHDKSLI